MTAKKEYGIIKEATAIKFLHAPLNSCEYLMEKFYYDNRRPEEINLEWQITKVLCLDRRVMVEVLACRSVNIWVILGG